MTIELSETVSPHQDNGHNLFSNLSNTRWGGGLPEARDVIVTAVRDVTVCFVGDFIFLNAENVCRFRPIPFIVISHKKKNMFLQNTKQISSFSVAKHFATVRTNE